MKKIKTRKRPGGELQHPGLVELTDRYEAKLKKLIDQMDAKIREAEHAAGELPGFTPEERRGVIKYLAGEVRFVAKHGAHRPGEWGTARLFYLWLDVRRVYQQRRKEGWGRSERNACDALRRSSAGSKWYRGASTTTLFDRLQEAKELPAVEHMRELEERDQRPKERLVKGSDGKMRWVKIKNGAKPTPGGGDMITPQRSRRIIDTLLRDETRAEVMAADDPEEALIKYLRPALYR